MNGEQKQPIQPPKSKWKAFFGKKWTFPVIYMGAAALILALIMWYQDSRDFAVDPNSLKPEVSLGTEQQPGTNAVGTTTSTPDAMPVNQTEEKGLAWPVAEGTEVDVIMNFYDDKATEEVKEAAIIQYEDSFFTHTGIDLATKDKSPFDVTAALSGEVVKAEKDPMAGYIIEIQHENGLHTVYQSLENIKVAAGEKVEQGALLGVAGRNLFEKDLGIHLHFEVKENGQSVSPEPFLNKEKDQRQAQ